MEGSTSSYRDTVSKSIRTLWAGLKITFRHILKARKSQRPIIISSPTYFDQTEGIATIQYPHEMQPIPDTGRYRLHNEIDDCIVCDKCAKVCPVNCITIEPIKSTEEIGKTSDGTPKRIYAATFDIDMGKCCFCGLCTTVCPTECLTMTKVYDFSVFDIREHNFAFGEMTTAEISEKKNLWDEHQLKKKAAAPVAPLPTIESKPAEPKEEKTDTGEAKPKPVFKPKIKPLTPPPAIESKDEDVKEQIEEKKETIDEAPKPKPVFRPKIKLPTPPPVELKEETPAEEKPVEEKKDEGEAPKPKPVFRPKIKPPGPPPSTSS